MSKTTAGDVTLTLGGEERALKCFLGAAIAINDHFGGLANAESRVIAVDLSAMTFIVAAGLGVTTKAEREEIAEQVFAAGATNLCMPLIHYLNAIGRGGQDKTDDAKPGTTKAAA
jgi:hypothetical protein